MSSESDANLKAMTYILMGMAFVWTVVYSCGYIFGFEVSQDQLTIGTMALVAWSIAFVWATIESFS